MKVGADRRDAVIAGVAANRVSPNGSVVLDSPAHRFSLSRVRLCREYPCNLPVDVLGAGESLLGSPRTLDNLETARRSWGARHCALRSAWPTP